MNESTSRIELLKVVSHPARIAILDELSKGVKCVSDFQGFLEISQPNISQHLSALRLAGIIDFFIDGRLRCYFLKNPFILDLLEILKKQYAGELPGPECCPVTKKGTYPGERRR
ncbi:MAG: winged helix-turn-helix transcriptional regulator [Nitrospirae bacterium]|nr:winged helix-turn-helix transcriptional regulator [Nitrospirota bacterium]